MKKNWRQTYWKDFTTKQKWWFVIMCVSLFIVLVIAGLSTTEVIAIPDWISIGLVSFMVFSLAKFLQITPWALTEFASDED